MATFEEIKEWIIKSCNDYRGEDGVIKFVQELNKKSRGDWDLLADTCYELVSAYRGKLRAQRFVYDDALVINATDEEIKVAYTFCQGFNRWFEIGNIISLMYYKLNDENGNEIPMPNQDMANRISQSNPDVIRWVNKLPFSFDQKIIILCGKGVLERPIQIVQNAEYVRKGLDTNEQALKEMLESDPSPIPAILPVGMIPERIVKTS